METLEIELKNRQCAKFPSAGRPDEAQVRDQLNRLGDCLLESLLIFRQALADGDGPSAEEAQEEMGSAYASYWEKCQHPPAPPPTTPKDRTARQLEAYFRELAVVLNQDCRQKIHQGLDLMNGWTSTTPEATVDSLKKTRTTLEKLPRTE